MQKTKRPAANVWPVSFNIYIYIYICSFNTYVIYVIYIYSIYMPYSASMALFCNVL